MVAGSAGWPAGGSACLDGSGPLVDRLVRAGEAWAGVESGPAPWGTGLARCCLGWLPQSAPSMGRSRSWRLCAPLRFSHGSPSELPVNATMPEVSPGLPWGRLSGSEAPGVASQLCQGLPL